ncbi:MAG: glycosyltransferase, partial [Candidatus Entotheonellia bacterium]
LAPYDPTCFPNGQIAYATLKVPEYMACARPVASVASGHILRLLQPGISGFLFPNQVPSWTDFLQTLPPRDRLQKMGRAAAQAASHYSWEKTAAGYLAACERLMRQAPGAYARNGRRPYGERAAPDLCQRGSAK